MAEKKIYIAHLKQTEQGVNEVQTVKQHCIQSAANRDREGLNEVEITPVWAFE